MACPPKIKKRGREKGFTRSIATIEKQKISLQKSKNNGTYLPWGFKPKSLYPIEDIQHNTGDI